MPSYSHSKIGAFEACPLQYKLAYIDRVEVEAEDTIETFLGSRVHEALEKLYRDKLYEKSMSLEELLAFYNAKWEENWKDSVIVVKKEYSPENYRKIGERCLRDYYNRYKPFDSGKVIGLETKELLPLDKEGRYRFHIRIDRLMDMGNGVYEVHDYKTGASLPKQEELDQDTQLAMYSLWIRKHFKDFKKVRLVWHFVALDKEMDSYRTKKELDGLRKEILEKIKEIEAAEDYPAKVSRLCDWCLYKSICPMWRHGEELESKPENEYLNDSGLKLVDEYVRIKEELDEQRREADEKLEKLKEALIAFCEREEVKVVFGSEKKITVSESEFIRLPAKNTEERNKLVQVLKSIGKFNDVSELDIYALAKVLQKKEWTDEEFDKLAKFWATEKSYRLSISKK